MGGLTRPFFFCRNISQQLCPSQSLSCDPQQNSDFSLPPACPHSKNVEFAVARVSTQQNMDFRSSVSSAQAWISQSPACPQPKRDFSQSPACPHQNRDFSLSPACPHQSRDFSQSPAGPQQNVEFTVASDRTILDLSSAWISQLPGCPQPNMDLTVAKTYKTTARERVDRSKRFQMCQRVHRSKRFQPTCPQIQT